MARPLRIEYPDAWYHVMNRGASRQNIFLNTRDFELFLDLLSEIYACYQIQIHAYCLMSNHYHLLIHTPQANLSKAMRHLDGLYTVRHNRVLGKDGPLFRGRYKAILIEAENYLLHLSRYIHINPVEAKMVQSPGEYPWSSYKYFISNKHKPDWLCIKETLKHFKDNSNKKYKSFVEESLHDDVFMKSINKLQFPILGSEEFIKRIKEEKISHKVQLNVPEHCNLIKRFSPTIEEVIRTVENYFDNSCANTLSNGKEKRSLVKKYAIFLSQRLTGESQRVIGAKFGGLTYSTVSKISSSIEMSMKENDEIVQHINKLIDILSKFKT